MAAAREAGQARCNIWQLDVNQCAVVGACLSLGELRRELAQAKAGSGRREMRV